MCASRKKREWHAVIFLRNNRNLQGVANPTSTKRFLLRSGINDSRYLKANEN